MMSVSGPANIPSSGLPLMSVSESLSRGLEIITDLSEKISALDRLLLTGKPHDIASAAAEIEQSLSDAKPMFDMISDTMNDLGARNLALAAEQLRQNEDYSAASLAESLRSALASFAKKSVSAKSRASQLNRGLNMSLRALQSLGVQESGRLIAEA
jgi:hypothetical protein